MSRYVALWEYVKNADLSRLKLSFDEIEKITGFAIDHSFLTYKKELENFGYRVEKISLKEKNVTFIKIQTT